MPSAIEAKLMKLIEPSLKGLGYSIVRLQLQGATTQILQIMIEHLEKPTAPITLEDCEKVSRQLSAELDVADPISGEYRLEVSSPGIDRPLTRLADFERFKGFDAKLETHDAVDGRKRFKGALQGVRENLVGIEVDGVAYGIPFPAIKTAKLLLTDALIDATLNETA